MCDTAADYLTCALQDKLCICSITVKYINNTIEKPVGLGVAFCLTVPVSHSPRARSGGVGVCVPVCSSKEEA